MQEILTFDERIDELALMALYQELVFDDKPGLVSMNSNGSHKDMNFEIMKRGLKSLKGYFQICFEKGFFEEDFKSLRKIGRKYEDKMFEATGGINTHQGVIFSLGIFVYLLGKICKNPANFNQFDDLNSFQELIKFYILNDLALMEVFEEGTEGARGEVASFFSKSFKSLKYEFEDRIYAIIADENLRDTNVIRRRGEEIHNQFKLLAKEVLISKGEEARDKIKNFALENFISPGGAADIFIISIFIEDFMEFFKSYFQDIEEEKLRFKEHIYSLTKQDAMVYSLVFPGFIKDLSKFRSFYMEQKEKIFFLKDKRSHFYRFGYYSYARLNGLSKDMLKLIKMEMVKLEEVGLIDVDIYFKGKALGRRELGLDERRCLLCDEKARDCYVNRTHKPFEIVDKAIKKVSRNREE